MASYAQARSDFDRSFSQHIQQLSRAQLQPAPKHHSTRQPRDMAGRFTTSQRDPQQPPRTHTPRT